RFTTSYDEVAEFGDVHFICVGTPQRPDGLAADLSYVETAVTQLARRLTRKALIVGKSTVPVGTAEWVEDLVQRFSPVEAGGADVSQLAWAIGYDPRIGNKFLRAGLGFGGACLPKDIRAFQARAQELGVGEALRFLHEVDLINQRRRQRVIQLAAELLGRPNGPAGPDLGGLKIAVLGATFKPNSDDVRD